MKSKLAKLIVDNPTMEVKFFVTSDEVLEDFHYSQQSINSVEISEWAEYNDRLFTDYDSLLDEIGYVNDIEDVNSKEAEDITYDLIRQVILVKLGA